MKSNVDLSGLTGGRETPNWKELDGTVVYVRCSRPNLYNQDGTGASFSLGERPDGVESDSFTITERIGFPSLFVFKLDGMPYAVAQIGSYSEHTNSATIQISESEYEWLSLLHRDSSIRYRHTV